MAKGRGGAHGSVSFCGEGTINSALPSITRAKSASRSLTLKASCCNRSSGFSARLRSCASLAICDNAAAVLNCAKEKRRCVFSRPSCSFSSPKETSTIGELKEQLGLEKTQRRFSFAQL